jgi:N-acetyl-gamma-glutamyl-phosphate reductase
MPIVADYYRGMAVCVPFVTRLLKKAMTAAQVAEYLAEAYQGERFVKVNPFNDAAQLEDGFFKTLASNGTNRCDLTVFGHEEQILVIARLDNLGKGASGAAVQCMNIQLGFEEGAGLVG